MNERIRELAKQANEIEYETFDEYNHKTVKHYKFNKEKFAELIVRECVDTVLDSSVEYTTRPQVASEIKQHFGVEE